MLMLLCIYHAQARHVKTGVNSPMVKPGASQGYAYQLAQARSARVYSPSVKLGQHRTSAAAALLAQLRAASLSPERRREIAQGAAKARAEKLSPRRRKAIATKASQAAARARRALKRKAK
jgi:hypothetical protein